MAESMMNTSIDSPKPKRRFQKTLLVVVILIAVVEFVLLVLNNQKAPPTSVSTTGDNTVKVPGDLEASVEGNFKLTTSGNPSNYAVSVPITVSLTADSNGRGVVGFDTIVEYDETAFTLGSLNSNVAGFSAVSNTQQGYLEITASKDPQTTTTPVFKDTVVATFTLTPRKAGTYTIEIADIKNNSSTKFIDLNTEVFLPETNSVSVTVK